jgi:hypothetical protein
MDTELRTIIEDNKLLDTEDWLLELDRNPEESDLDESFAIGACRYVKLNTTGNGFMSSVRRQLESKGSLSNKQLLVVLKIMREKLGKANYEGGIAPELGEGSRYTCQDCVDNGELFECETWPQLRRHKQYMHGIARPYAPEDDEVRTGSVLSVGDDTGLDLSLLPDGVYAAPDRTGKDEMIFLRIRRTRRSIKRSRRFVYGKIRSGKEWVPAGTIEVRQQVGSTKRLCGEQRPGATHRGEYKTELAGIMKDPERWGYIAGLKLGHCCICYRDLTSDYKDIGIGPECLKKPNYWGTTPPDYAALEKERKARKAGLAAPVEA